MRKTIKKLLILLVLTVLILSSLNFNYQVEATTNGYTADTAIEYVKSLVGQKIEIDGAYYYQCVDLIMAYELELSGFYDTGSAVDFGYNTLPDGWTRIQGGTPQKGDILIYSPTAGNPNGHVAIYESDYETYHQNYIVQYVTKISNYYTQMYDKYGEIMPYWGVIRPDFAPSDAENPIISSAYVDPASMTGSSYTVRIVASDNVGLSKVPIMTWSLDNGQDDIKEYRATSNGSEYSYTIKASNHGNNKGLYNSHVYAYDEAGNGVKVRLNNIPMDTKVVKNLGSFEARIVLKEDQNYVVTASGTNQNASVILGEKSVSDKSQIWQFNQKSDGSYEIVNVASNRALYISNATDEDGANVAIHTKNDSDAQTFYIMEYNGGYRLVPKCTSNLKAIDLADNRVEAGRTIDLYNAYSVNNDAQTWIFEDTETLIGDVNEDGAINSTDYLKILAHVKKRATLTQDEQTRADIDKDGDIDSTDYLKLLAYVKKKISSL